jgi:hypothetical protein
MNFIKDSKLTIFRRLAKVSHPVSKYNESLLANFVKHVTIRAASNRIFSNLSMSRS